MEWIKAYPVEAAALASRSNAIFRSKFALETQLAQLPGFLSRVTASMAQATNTDDGLVEIILRVGSRPAEMVRRALQSIADQTHPRIGLILVCFRPVAGLDELLAEFKIRFERVTYVNVPDNGMRSTALWAGLKAAQGDFVSNLDDDDTIHPTHVASQLRAFVAKTPEPLLVYSGVVERQEEDGHWFGAINFSGDIGKTIEERRRLRFLEPFSRERMLRFDNFIQSNCWMIRTSSLTEDILVDPETRVAEDVLLYLLLMERGDFMCTWRVTADWNWRSTSKENSMFATEQWSDIGRVIQRLELAGVKPILTESKATLGTMAADQQKFRLTLKQILRKPSILLGPLAPRWRRYKAKKRAK
jgi:phosphoglycerol transferase